MQYENINCHICNKEIPKNGAALSSHMRMHVRKKEAVEEKCPKTGKLIFKNPNKVDEYVEMDPYAKLGEEPLKGQPKGVWEITEALNNLPVIDPKCYYITSGEAVRKAEKLTKDAYSLAVKAKSFEKALIKAREEAKYLETQRENGKLLIKKKSPRKKKENPNG
jgi:hypothetical protein